MRMRKKQEKGSLTVEMAIVLPIVLLTIFGMIYLSIVHYQNMVTATAAMQTAAKAAANWNTLGSGDSEGWYVREVDGQKILVTRPDYGDHDPYGSILDTEAGTRLDNVEAYMEWLMTGNPTVFEGETTSEATAEKTGGLLQKYISVSIEKTYINPLGNLMESIGIADSDTNVITAKAPLNTPTEFIRNISFIEELVNRLK